jgi:cell wall-associated NlpC family hydrolase
VRRVISAANRLVRKRYKWGGGHKAFTPKLARGYDCSGAVSYALYGARALTWPLDSTGLMKWGRPGPGRWITVYANKKHTYLVVAGTRFDTSMHDLGTPGPTTGPRWSVTPRPRKSFRARHPLGL